MNESVTISKERYDSMLKTISLLEKALEVNNQTIKIYEEYVALLENCVQKR